LTLPVFKFSRLYGPRAEGPRSARAALLQAAALPFNNPRAASGRSRELLLVGRKTKVWRARETSAARRAAAAEVNVTGQFEGGVQNDG